MDAQRFDRLARTFVAMPTRRATLGLGALGLLGILGLNNAGGKKKKKCKKKCGPCEKCKKGKCKPKADDTTCRGTGKCLQGQCNPLPTCIRALNGCPPPGSTVECCSEHCTVGPTLPACSFSGPGGLCVDDDDCFGEPCIGYRCQAR